VGAECASYNSTSVIWGRMAESATVRKPISLVTVQYSTVHRMTKHVRCQCQKCRHGPCSDFFLSERGGSRFCKRLYKEYKLLYYISTIIEEQLDNVAAVAIIGPM
jgi:hypothetical protein